MPFKRRLENSIELLKAERIPLKVVPFKKGMRLKFRPKVTYDLKSYVLTLSQKKSREPLKKENCNKVARWLIYCLNTPLLYTCMKYI